ncbi:four helix bundle protein [Candidatus Saccharibacteria bacterium]|nr:four helix bundle protein [Candidatus Saccharibacteria bacterium]
MAQIQQFEDILAWQKAKILTLNIYALTKTLNDRSFSNQLQRAAVSIMNNIAEGFERKSNKELSQFLFIAKGSCGEVRSMIHLGEDLGYSSKEESRNLMNHSLEISKMLSGFIKRL